MTPNKPQRSDNPDGGFDYKLNGAFHRDDGPAVASGKGDTWWFQHNLLHRDGGPAVEHANGSKWWFQHGKLHRTDGPAYEGADGVKAWYINGQPVPPPGSSGPKTGGKGPRP